MAPDGGDTLSAEPDHDDAQDHPMTDDVEAILAGRPIEQNISVPPLPPIVLPKAGSTDDNAGIENSSSEMARNVTIIPDDADIIDVDTYEFGFTFKPGNYVAEVKKEPQQHDEKTQVDDHSNAGTAQSLRLQSAGTTTPNTKECELSQSGNLHSEKPSELVTTQHGASSPKEKQSSEPSPTPVDSARPNPESDVAMVDAGASPKVKVEKSLGSDHPTRVITRWEDVDLTSDGEADQRPNIHEVGPRADLPTSAPQTGQITPLPTVPSGGLGPSILHTRKPRSTLTADYGAVLVERQKMIAATMGWGREADHVEQPLPAIHETASSSVTDQPSTVPIPPPSDTRGLREYVGAIVDEQAARSQEQSQVEEDSTALEFRLFRESYEKKKAAGDINAFDKIHFARVEAAERVRITRREQDQLRARCVTPPPSVSDQNEAEAAGTPSTSLFLPAGRSTCISSKRRHSAANNSEEEHSDTESSTDSDSNENEISTCRDLFSHVSKHDDPALNDSLSVGFDYAQREIVNDEASKNGAKKKRGKKSNTDLAKPRPARKKKPAKDGASKTKKQKKAPRKSKKQPPDEPTKRKRVFGFIEPTKRKRKIKKMKGSERDQTLATMLASVPLKRQNINTSDIKDILEAADSYGGKAHVETDGEGGWSFRGMESKLMDHQVLGAAWMRHREISGEVPLGGINADSLGYGKTIQAIACILANRPPAHEERKTTLIVVPPTLLIQWQDELKRHTKDGDIGVVVPYYGTSRLQGEGAMSLIQKADIIVTTYGEVRKSYPVNKPPAEIVNVAERAKWWSETYSSERKMLHRINFYRVILDEAQTIKNHQASVSIACRGLMAKYRWALTGTPILNSIDECYPYFSFLKIPHIGPFDLFQENFCDTTSPNAFGRLHSYLRQIMLRRTERDKLNNAPLVDLPACHISTTHLNFNAAERALYKEVARRYDMVIKHLRWNEHHERAKELAYTKTKRLRSITTHVFMAQWFFQDRFTVEAIDDIWMDLGLDKPTPANKDSRDLLKQIKNMLSAKGTVEEASSSPGIEAEVPCVIVEKTVDSPEGVELCESARNYRQRLRSLKVNLKWKDLRAAKSCCKCKQLPENPQVTSCEHLYCKECVQGLAHEGIEEDEYRSRCFECHVVFTEAKPCPLKELEYYDPPLHADSEPGKAKERSNRKSPKEDMRWIKFEGTVLRSAKTDGVMQQVEEWQNEDASAKIIIFTEWLLMIKILGAMCEERGWGFCTFHGEMNMESRNSTMREFRESPEKKILISTLKCGGVGLNISFASRVISVDPWWNKGVEQQAFGRVHRIGQKSETYVTRLMVNDSIDDKIQYMQREKEAVIGTALDDIGDITEAELMKYFGKDFKVPANAPDLP